jgi:septal ring-binding cell division protein DamX
MVESDTVVALMKSPRNDSTAALDHFLITQERTEKLELLVHLLANLTQALILSGPKGSGKTLLLKILQERKTESWQYCLISGNTDLSFENIQEPLKELLQQDQSYKNIQPLTKTFTRLESQRRIILIMDDAGLLEPGLITRIIHYAAANRLLRVIFALTPDDLFIKNASDSAIDECLLVELPLLSEKQCGDFLQYLSIKPGACLTSATINEQRTAAIYRQTHGVPGRIIAEITRLTTPRKAENSLLILGMAVAGLVVIALGVQWFTASANRQSEAPIKAEAEISKSLPAAEEAANRKPITDIQNKSDTVVLDKGIENKQVLVETQKKVIQPLISANKSHSLGSQALSSSQAEPAEIAVTTSGATGGQDDREWLYEQPADNYTLQLMMLPKEQSIKDFIKKYQTLYPGFRYIKTITKDKEAFLLLYGSFTSAVLANKARLSLPV